MRIRHHPHTLVVCAAALAVAAALAGRVPASAQELPAPRAHHQLVHHEGEQRVFLVGGSTPRDGGHHFFDDIWSWDGTAWQRAGSLPFPRSSHRVAWHSARNALVLFGGGSGRTFAADSLIREWNEAAWQPVGHSPYGGLAEPGVCHDRKRARLVLFGGWDAANRFHGGTWEWTGDTLLNIAATGPSARGGHMFVYDTQRQRCLLFGGLSDDGVLADTWEWDGTAWQQIHAPGPSARMVGGAATDHANDRIILFSGWTADQTLLDDTWAWDGETWELIGRGGPLPRISAQLAFDGTGVVLFGGRTRTADGFRDLNDTWRLEGSNWVRMRVPQAADTIGDGGPGTRAVLIAPEGVALDASGNIYVSERAAHRVRRIDASTRVISTFAGTGVAGYSGDGGPAARAQVSLPTDVAVDSHGNVYVAEPGTHRIRRVDAATGVITTFAGTGVRGFSGDGGPASRAALSSPFGVAVDSHDNVYVSDTDNHRIRRIDAATGLIRTVVGNGTVGFGGDGGAATAASLARPHRVVPVPNGDLYVGDSFNHRIRWVDARTRVIRTFVGTGRLGSGGGEGPALEAANTYTGGLALDSAGGLVFPTWPRTASGASTLRPASSPPLPDPDAGTSAAMADPQSMRHCICPRPLQWHATATENRVLTCRPT